MALNEFYEWLEKQPILTDKLVSLRFKYSWDEYWIYSKEYLSVDVEGPCLYTWLNDWHEGQQDVEVLGCIDVEDIEIPDFNEH